MWEKFDLVLNKTLNTSNYTMSHGLAYEDIDISATEFYHLVEDLVKRGFAVKVRDSYKNFVLNANGVQFVKDGGFCGEIKRREQKEKQDRDSHENETKKTLALLDFVALQKQINEDQKVDNEKTRKELLFNKVVSIIGLFLGLISIIISAVKD